VRAPRPDTEPIGGGTTSATQMGLPLDELDCSSSAADDERDVTRDGAKGVRVRVRDDCVRVRDDVQPVVISCAGCSNNAPVDSGPSSCV
jgi:hypothetical protein